MTGPTTDPSAGAEPSPARPEPAGLTLLRVALIFGGIDVLFGAAWAAAHPAFGAAYEAVWWVDVLIYISAGYVASQGRSWRLGAAGGLLVAAVELTLGTLVWTAIRPELLADGVVAAVGAVVLLVVLAPAMGLVGAGIARLVVPRRPPAVAMISLLFVVGIAGHVGGVWEIPRLRWASATSPSAVFDPRSVTVSYVRAHLMDASSPWTPEMADQIMSRFAQRWSEATLGRSRATVMDDTDVRDVLVVFSDKHVDLIDLSRAQVGRFSAYGGGRIRMIELLVLPRFDAEYTVGTLLHEFGHALGCCTGPGTSAGHFIGVPCTRILCSIHGNARVFTEDELTQMGLGR